MGNIGSREAQGQLLSAQAEAIDPFVRHGVEIGRVSVRFLAAHKIRGRVRQLPVMLPEIGEDETLDLSGPLRLVQPVHGSVLRAIKYRAENAEHPRENKLTRRVLPQAIASRAANDRIDGNDVQADIGRTVRPETAEAEIIVDAAIGQDDAAALERAVLLESERFVKRRQKERICRRCGDSVRDRHIVAVELAPAPGAGLHRAEAERRAGPEFRGVDDEMRLRRQVFQRRAFEQQIVERGFEQGRPAGKAMERRPDVEALEMGRKRPRRDQARDLAGAF